MSETNLNGTWKMVWDPENKGVTSRWFAEIPSKAKNVEVPHLWSENATATAFYYKKFSLSAKDKRCLLHFEQASVYAVVWVNGKLAGDHFGASTSFEFDISQFAKTSHENLLCVKISSVLPGGNFELMAGGDPIPAEQMPLGLPWKRHPFAGLAGKVSMTSGERALLTSMEIASNADHGRINVKLSFNNPRNYVAKLKIFARDPKLEVSSIQKEIKLEKENTNIIVHLRFKDIKLWSIETPEVYALEVRLDGSNYLYSNFGFKKFDCKQGDFFLNDSVIKIHGITYSHRRDASIKEELEHIKELGFNAVRTGGAPFNREALEECDKLGLLVFQEFPICDEQSSKMGLEAIKAIAPEIVCESANHPSLAAWILGSENGRLILENGAKLLNRIDTLESCHPAISNINNVSIDNDQIFKHGHEKTFSATGKIIGVTDGTVLPYSSHYLALKIFGGVPFTLFLSRYGISEDKDFVIPDPFFGDDWLQENYKLFTDDVKKNGKVLLSIKNHHIFGSVKNNADMQSLAQKIKNFIGKNAKDIWQNAESFAKNSNELALSGLDQNIQCLQSSPVVSGFFIEEWADFKNDLSGIINESGESKGLEQSIKNITASTRLLLSGLERVVAKNESISFQLSLLNEKRLNEISISVQLLDKSGRVAVSQSKNFSVPKFTLASLSDLSLKAPQKTGSYSLKLTLASNEKEIYSMEEPIEVIDAPNIKNVLAKSEFLDAAENSSEIIKMINSKKPVLFTAALSSWADNSILESVANAVKVGKILFISDIIPEDIRLLNNFAAFGCSLEYFYSSGAAGASIHYIPKESEFESELFGKSVLDKTCSAIVPSLSMLKIKDAESFVHSVSIKNSELQTGVDLQIMPYGKGKIIFSTLNFEGLDTYALTNSLFIKIIKLATE
ncbi:beta-galactosidase [Fibrobacteria bacterium R8-3-H12]